MVFHALHRVEHSKVFTGTSPHSSHHPAQCNGCELNDLGHELELSSDSFSTIKLTATKRIRGQIKRTETDTGSSAQRTSSPQCGPRAVNKLTAMRIRGQSQRHTQHAKQNAINKQYAHRNKADSRAKSSAPKQIRVQARRTSSPQCGSRAMNKLTAMRIRRQVQRHTQQSTKQNVINKQQTKYRPTANTADPRANRNITKMNTNVLTNNTHRKSEPRV